MLDNNISIEEILTTGDWESCTYTPLCQFAADGDIDNMRLAINYCKLLGYDISAEFEQGYDYHLRKGTALTEAILNNNISCADLLINEGANVNCYSLEPDVDHQLAYCQTTNDISAVQLAYSADKSLFKRILDIGCDITDIYRNAIITRDTSLIYSLSPYIKDKECIYIDCEYSNLLCPPAYYAAYRLIQKNDEKALDVLKAVISISGCPLTWYGPDNKPVSLEFSMVDILTCYVSDKDFLSSLGLGNVIHKEKNILRYEKDKSEYDIFCSNSHKLDIKNENRCFNYHAFYAYRDAVEKINLFYDVVNRVMDISIEIEHENLSYFPFLDDLIEKRKKYGYDFFDLNRRINNICKVDNKQQDRLHYTLESMLVVISGVKDIIKNSHTLRCLLSEEYIAEFSSLDEYMLFVHDKVEFKNNKIMIPFDILKYIYSRVINK